MNHNFDLKLHYKFLLHWTYQRWLSGVPYLHMKNTLPAVKKVSDCPLTISEPVPKKGLSVEAQESRRTNIGVTRINFLFTTYSPYPRELDGLLVACAQ